MSNQSHQVQKALAATKQYQKELNTILGDPIHVHNRLTVNGFIDRISTRLVFMGAVLEPSTDEAKKEQDLHPPITNFMGDEIKMPQKVTTEDLVAGDDEKKKYLAKVDKLWAELPKISPESILNSYRMPDDVLVLRGVAKRAGVADFAERELTTAFIEDIILGVEVKNEENVGLAQIEKNLKDQWTPQIVTQEMIDADPDLQKWKAKVGDELAIRAGDGKRKLNRVKPPVETK